MKVREDLRELERAGRRLREAIERDDVEAALAIIGGAYTDLLTDVIFGLVRQAQLQDVTPERCGILLGMPATTIYKALSEGARR